MALGLLVANLMALIGLLIGALYGYWHAETHTYFRQHFLLAMPASLISIFSHCMTFFYFIGMTKQVKDWCARHQLDPDIIKKMRSFRSGAAPYISLAILLTMGVTILGGGAATTRGWLATFHAVLAYLALAANAIAIYIEYRYLVANNLLMQETLRMVTGNKS